MKQRYSTRRRRLAKRKVNRFALARAGYRIRSRTLPRAVFPSKKLVRLKYTENITINPGAAGAIAYHQFSCNGMYDPNRTGVGHQPIGFDQWMSWYDHYHVIGSKITVYTRSVDTTTDTIVGIYKSDTNSFSPTTAEHACELPGAVYKHLPRTGTGDATSIKVRSKYSPRKDQSSSKVLSDDQLRGDANNDPTEQHYFTIFAAAPYSADPTTISVWVHIEYLAVFTEPKAPVQS